MPAAVLTGAFFGDGVAGAGVSDRQQRAGQNVLQEEVKVIADAGFSMRPSIIAILVNHRTNGLESIKEIAQKTQPV